MTKWKGGPPKLSPDQIQRLMEVRAARAVLVRIPTNIELAQEMGVHQWTIGRVMHGQGPKRYRKLFEDR